MIRKVAFALVLWLTLALNCAAAEPVKEGRLDRICGWFQKKADDHPKVWKGVKFGSKATLFVLNCAGAIGNIVRYGN